MRKIGVMLMLILLVVFFASCSNKAAFFKEEGKSGRDFLIGPEWREFKGFGVIDKERYPNEAQAILMAKEAAYADAVSKAVKYFLGLKLEGGSTVENYIAKNVEVKTKFYGFIKGVQIVDSGMDEKLGAYWVIIRVYRKDVEEILGQKFAEFPEVSE